MTRWSSLTLSACLLLAACAEAELTGKEGQTAGGGQAGASDGGGGDDASTGGSGGSGGSGGGSGGSAGSADGGGAAGADGAAGTGGADGGTGGATGGTGGATGGTGGATGGTGGATGGTGGTTGGTGGTTGGTGGATGGTGGGAPSCTDGVKNGSESDVDCGGTCGKCANGKACTIAGDCTSGACASNKCAWVVQVDPTGNNTFSPSTLTIPVGGVVRWVWQKGGHTVTGGTGCGNYTGWCSPTDTNCSSSPNSSQGSTYDHAFTTAGTFPYYCRPHCSMMKGTVTVQ
ncbi:MAG: plastocyanin/azurin family copper-binding protein [Polyangiaceae bacterium]